MNSLNVNRQYIKFCAYGFLRNLRFFESFFILFLVEKGLSYTEIGALYAIRETCINIFEIPSGVIADSYGRKSSLVASFLAYIISFIIFYISHDFWMFLPAFILYGIGDAFRTGTHKGLIMNYLKLNEMADQKINYYGHTRSWSQKGAAISSLAAGVIVFYSGNYHAIFLYSIIPYLINLFLIISYPNELDSLHRHESGKGRGIVVTFKAFFKNLKNPGVLKIVNVSALHSAYLKAVKDYIQPLMLHVVLIIPIMLSIEKDRKSGLIIGIMYFLIYLMTSFASKFSGRVFDTNRKHIAYITLLCGFFCGIICGIFYIYELWVVSLLAFIGIYIVENIRKPIMTGFIADNVENEVLASVISVESQVRTVMTSIIALGFGIAADSFGIGAALIAVTVFLLMSSLAVNSYNCKINQA